jgi:hypothetical protein
MSHPHYKLIYGASARVCSDVQKPFQKYKFPCEPLAKHDVNEYSIVGFEYGRIYGMYENSEYSYGTMRISNSTVPNQVVELFRQTYPGVDATCYALINDVTSPWMVEGLIAYGYWIMSDNRETLRKLNDKSYNSESLIISTNYGHNVKNNISDFFYGKTVDHFDTADSDSADGYKKLAKQFNHIYEPVEIPARETILSELHTIDPEIQLSEFPMLVLIQTHCYCCS